MNQEIQKRTPLRKIKLSSSSQLQITIIGAATGIMLALVGLRPTGAIAVDVVLLSAACAFIVWASCTSPWAVLVVCGAVATAWNPLGAGTVLGLAAIGLSVWIGVQQRSNPLARGVATSLTLLSLAFVGNPLRAGVSALVGFIVIGALGVSGLRRRPRADRRLAFQVVGVAVAVSLVAGVLAALAGFSARTDLRSANSHSDKALVAMRSAEFGEASREFAAASVAFKESHAKLTAPWAQPIRLVPIAAQNWRAATTVTDGASTSSSVIAQNVGAVDPSRLTMKNGKIDLDAVRGLEQPLTQVRQALGTLDEAVNTSASPWLAPAVSRRLAALGSEIDHQQRLGDKTLEALRLAPSILGAEETRHYFVMFTTPAEARGQGGFMGNYAEITVSDGKFEVVTIDRESYLNENLAKLPRVVLADAPQDWMATWGQFGFKLQPGDAVASDAWSIINMSGHFPHTAEVIHELYPKSGGTELDGVFSLDIYGIEALVGLVGPIDLIDAPTLNGENTAQYLLYDQYLDLSGENAGEANANRVDRLGNIAEVVTERLLSSNPPDPISLGKALAPLAQTDRLLAWSAHPEEAALFEDVGMAGAALTVNEETADEAAQTQIKLVVNNSGGNKIDSFLRVSAAVDDTGATYTLTNTAPTSGLPGYIIGSARDDLPPGTSRLIVSVYSSDLSTQVQASGETAASPGMQEAGFYLNTGYLILGPGESKSIRVNVTDGPPVLIPQPLAEGVFTQSP